MRMRWSWLNDRLICRSTPQATNHDMTLEAVVFMLCISVQLWKILCRMRKQQVGRSHWALCTCAPGVDRKIFRVRQKQRLDLESHIRACMIVIWEFLRILGWLFWSYIKSDNNNWRKFKIFIITEGGKFFVTISFILSSYIYFFILLSIIKIILTIPLSPLCDKFSKTESCETSKPKVRGHAISTAYSSRPTRALFI